MLKYMKTFVISRNRRTFVLTKTNNNLNLNIMTTLDAKQLKVKALLLKWGNNEETANRLIEENYKYASYLTSVKSIAEFVRTV